MERLSDYSCKSNRERKKDNWIILNASFHGVKSLLALAYSIAAGAANFEASVKNRRKYFLPREAINSYNLLIDGRNFYDEERKTSLGKSDDYTTGCLFDYAYFNDNYSLITVDVSKQKALGADPRAIQQIVFQEVVGGADNTKVRLYTIFGKSKERVLEFYKGTAKALWIV